MHFLQKTSVLGAAAGLLVACTTQVPKIPSKMPVAGVSCALLATNFVAKGVRITAAEIVPAGLTVPGMATPIPMPEHCKVTG